MPPKTKDKCAQCGIKAYQQKFYLMICCDCCESWYHSQYQNLSKQEANLISTADLKGVRWFCHICCPTFVVKTSSQATTTDAKLEATNQSIKNLSTKLENAVDSNHSGKSNTPYRDALKLNTKTILESVSENAVIIKKFLELLQQSLDNADSEAQKVNTILFGLKYEPEKQF